MTEIMIKLSKDRLYCLEQFVRGGWTCGRGDWAGVAKWDRHKAALVKMGLLEGDAACSGQHRITPEGMRCLQRYKVAQAICAAFDDDWTREGPSGLIEAYGPVADAALDAASRVRDAAEAEATGPSFAQWERSVRLLDEQRIITTEVDGSGAVTKAWADNGQVWPGQ